MRTIRAREFRGSRAWEALDVASIEGASVRLHWTDQPYTWHVNHGEEVFAVLDGVVQMRYREAGVEQSVLLKSGDVFHAGDGDEHVAHPQGEARILVIEKAGSI
jgi:mannose-6-phosphate isomerase-like protein (cupin superfamily)